MQELRRILIKKGKTMGELKYPLRSNRQAMIHHLKSIRKQQALNESTQTRILSSLDSLSFETKQQLQNLYHFSFTVMKSFSKQLEFTPWDNEVYTNILQLHEKFYDIEGAHEIGNRIRCHMNYKTMLEKKFLLKKLVQWLYGWVKSRFSESLNRSICLVDRTILADKIFDPAQAIENPSYSVAKQDKQRKLTFKGIRMNLLSTQMLKKKINKIQGKAVTQNSPSLLTEQAEIIFLKNQQQILKTCYETSTRISTSYDNEQSVEFVPNTIGLKKRSFSYNREGVQKQKSTSVVPHINREIFFGAFNQQLSQLYKSMSDVMDVDTYYLRAFRRQREELRDQIISTRMDEVVEGVVKNMPKIQKPMNKYLQDYNKYCPEHIKSFHSETLIRSPPKAEKPTFLQQYPRERFSLSQKLKSQEIFNNDKQIQQLFKNTKTSKFRQRNRSIQQRFTRKLSQEKTQILTKFPVAYNGDVFNRKQDDKTGKAITIHQKLQNLTSNANKLQNNKGLARYKVLNKDREKVIIQEETLINDSPVSYGIDLFETKKLNQFQVANIRKLLRIREKQKASNKKTPITVCVKSKNQELDNLMEEAREIESQRSKNLNPTQKTNRYEVFLNSLNRVYNGSKMMDKQSATQNQQNDTETRSSSRNKQTDYLPKLA